MPPSLLQSLSALHIPADFARYDSVSEPEIISHLEIWKSNASQALSELKTLIDQHERLSTNEQADVITTLAPLLDDNDSWISRDTKHISEDILHNLPDPDETLLRHILTHNVKPLFVSTPHPHLNLSTGRKLARPAGGPMAAQDFFEGQTWKENPGSGQLVTYLVKHIKSDDYEGLWHLIVPPVMTLLDDYQAQYKLQGIRVVSEMLKTVPSKLLKRTGLDALLLQSLTTCLGLVRDPESANLIRESISIWLTLTSKTTELGSTERFDRLCVLLGEHIMGAVWLYGSGIEAVILATIEMLPPIIRELGIGTARFIKGLMYQLLHPLQATSEVPASIQMQLASIDALLVVMDECQVRMTYWRGAILSAVARCWVTIHDRHDMNPKLTEALRAVCQALAKTCPSVVEVEFARLLALDSVMFGGLLGTYSRDR